MVASAIDKSFHVHVNAQAWLGNMIVI